jgi:hypothetical protein
MKKLTLISFSCLLLAAGISAQTVSSEEVKIHINNKPIPAVAEQNNILSLAGDNNTYGNYYALVIGIDNYADPDINKLKIPLRDADLFYNVITTRYIFEKNNVKFLKDPTLAEIADALDSFAKKVGTSDNFLIFYEGHGYWDDATEKGFWLPSDAKGTGYMFLPSDETDGKKFGWLSNKMLINDLLKINTKHTLLVTSSCFGGSVFSVKTVDKGPAVAINRLNELPGKKAITAGMLSNNNGQSNFLKYLLDNLEKNSEKYLPSEKLFINALRSASGNGNVIPRFGEITNSGDGGGDFIFILKD